MTRRHERITESESAFDLPAFSREVKAKRDGKPLRVVAAQLGLSASTICRIEAGRAPDIEGFARICQWLNIAPSYFMPGFYDGPQVGGPHSVKCTQDAARRLADIADHLEALRGNMQACALAAEIESR